MWPSCPLQVCPLVLSRDQKNDQWRSGSSRNRLWDRDLCSGSLLKRPVSSNTWKEIWAATWIQEEVESWDSCNKSLNWFHSQIWSWDSLSVVPRWGKGARPLYSFTLHSLNSVSHRGGNSLKLKVISEEKLGSETIAGKTHGNWGKMCLRA